MQKKEEDVHFFLTNNSGGYASLGNNSFSQYNGIFFFLRKDWELYKTIETIERTDNETLKGNFAYSENTLTYTSPVTESILITFDFRRIHDYSDEGRIYTITKQKKFVIVEYKKYSDNSLTTLVDTKYLAIKTNDEDSQNTTISNDWIKREYAYDRNRGIKHEFYVFNGLNITAKEITIGFGNSQNEAIKNASNKLIVQESEKSILKIAENSLQNLIINFQTNKNKTQSGILAGFPWFYQIWGRDECISLGGLIASKKYALVKEIIFRNLENLENRFVPNRTPSSTLASMDSTGWLYKRISDFLIATHQNNKIDTHISKNDVELILSKLDESISSYTAHIDNNLIINQPLETWMDTTDSAHTDTRSGARIEIQCLFLNMCILATYLSKILGKEYKKYEDLEKNTKEATKRELMNNGILLDGKDNQKDLTERPNVFLAHQVYPQLLSNSEWEKTFDKIIQECWLPWGGFSSISRTSNLFTKRHTGLNNSSYHRGDSWYFLNNLAALSLIKVNYKKYADQIEKIAEASIKELLYSGIPGQCAELSSAEEQTSEGCLAQAWSSSTLIELIHKLS